MFSKAFCRKTGDMFRMKRTRLEMHISRQCARVRFMLTLCVFFFFFFSFACMALKQTVHPCNFFHAGTDYPRVTGYNYYSVTGRRIDSSVSDKG